MIEGKVRPEVKAGGFNFSGEESSQLWNEFPFYTAKILFPFNTYY